MDRTLEERFEDHLRILTDEPIERRLEYFSKVQDIYSNAQASYVRMVHQSYTAHNHKRWLEFGAEYFVVSAAKARLRELSEEENHCMRLAHSLEKRARAIK